MLKKADEDGRDPKDPLLEYHNTQDCNSTHILSSRGSDEQEPERYLPMAGILLKPKVKVNAQQHVRATMTEERVT